MAAESDDDREYRTLQAVFEDGPPEKPVVLMADQVAADDDPERMRVVWPDHHGLVARNADGLLTLYSYRHVGAGHYRVSHEQVMDSGLPDLQLPGLG